ncbi:hypothetical protein [Streptomyces sp. NPDC000983]|uniref:hypothetical protein n=1 Tax=Streptomyces sp. NPDC000983 TaxID=3154373 RepID=UPI003332570D
MTAEITTMRVDRRSPETGWARARRLRGEPVRTCVRARLDGDAGQLRQDADWNVVRGED